MHDDKISWSVCVSSSKLHFTFRFCWYLLTNNNILNVSSPLNSWINMSHNEKPENFFLHQNFKLFHWRLKSIHQFHLQQMEVRLSRTMDRFFNVGSVMIMMMILFMLVAGGVVTLTISMFQSINTPSGGTQMKSIQIFESW